MKRNIKSNRRIIGEKGTYKIKYNDVYINGIEIFRFYSYWSTGKKANALRKYVSAYDKGQVELTHLHMPNMLPYFGCQGFYFPISYDKKEFRSGYVYDLSIASNNENMILGASIMYIPKPARKAAENIAEVYKNDRELARSMLEELMKK